MFDTLHNWFETLKPSTRVNLVFHLVTVLMSLAWMSGPSGEARQLLEEENFLKAFLATLIDPFIALFSGEELTDDHVNFLGTIISCYIVIPVVLFLHPATRKDIVNYWMTFVGPWPTDDVADGTPGKGRQGRR